MSGLNADGGQGSAVTVLKPEMDEKIAIELVSGLYRLNVKTIKELNSYYDRNYRITVEEEHTNPHIHTHGRTGIPSRYSTQWIHKNPMLVCITLCLDQ